MMIESKQEGDITIVTLNRPERRNALTAEACAQLSDRLDDSARSRVVILTGAGGAFCAGGDFEELERFAGSDPEASGEGLYSGFQRMIRTIRRLPVPVIAAVNGHAMGAGMDLALACDFRVASMDAKLGQVWVRVGLIPGTGGAFWVTLLAGPARAAQMILSGEPIDAETAQEWGLVNEAVTPEMVMPRARAIAETIASNPPEAVAANKKALNAVIEPAYEAALAHAKEVQPLRFASQEFRDALAAVRKGS
jgi:enoyl-CoA hydratase/carnithine racemase